LGFAVVVADVHDTVSIPVLLCIWLQKVNIDDLRMEWA
jgi:hypothetical protein